jgi:hypothetical protein
MEELGLVLVDESFATLRQVIRKDRSGLLPTEQVIRYWMDTLAQDVHDHQLHFRFLVRERYGGAILLRRAIRRELQLLVSELAADLIRLLRLNDWSNEDLQMLATLIVQIMILAVEALLDAPADRPEVAEEVLRTAERQLRLVLAGVPHWCSA